MSHPLGGLLSEPASASEEQAPRSARSPLGSLCVGCAGWSYPHWRHKFYPPNVRADQELTVRYS